MHCQWQFSEHSLQENFQGNCYYLKICSLVNMFFVLASSSVFIKTPLFLPPIPVLNTHNNFFKFCIKGICSTLKAVSRCFTKYISKIFATLLMKQLHQGSRFNMLSYLKELACLGKILAALLCIIIYEKDFLQKRRNKGYFRVCTIQFPNKER